MITVALVQRYDYLFMGPGAEGSAWPLFDRADLKFFLRSCDLYEGIDGNQILKAPGDRGLRCLAPCTCNDRYTTLTSSRLGTGIVNIGRVYTVSAFYHLCTLLTLYQAYLFVSYFVVPYVTFICMCMFV